MIADLATEVAAELRDRGVPVPVVYGPERFEDDAIVRTRIVFERDRDGGDGFGFRSEIKPVAAPAMAKIDHVRTQGGMLRIWAHNSVAGARAQDHERLADELLDRVSIAIRKCVSRSRTQWSVRSGKFLRAEDIAPTLRGQQVWHGVVYEMRFALERGVYDKKWDGAGPLLAPLNSVTNQTIVHEPDGDGSEIACGA